MKAGVRAFLGMRPVATADLLRPGEAQYALNAKFRSGSLEPFLAPAQPGAGFTFIGAPVVRTIYRFGQLSTSEILTWFQFTGDVDVVKGAVDNDTEERTYWTDGVFPKKTNAALATVSAPYPTNSLRMGLPAPTPALSAAVSGVATNAADPAETVTYVVTYVSSWGEEGPPSAASVSVNWRPGQTVNLTAIPLAPAGSYSITGKRIYRSATGSQSTKFQLVNTEGDVAIATAAYNDTKLTAVLGETLSTTGWLAPPDTMIGLTTMANGIMAGFTGNTLCFSVPYAPYAWPVRFQQSTDAPIVGIAAFDQSLFVATTQGIYIFTGVDPAAMASERLAVAQSCVSKRSIVAMLGGVLFASPDGLMRASSRGIENVTDDMMSRTEWQAYVPGSFSAYEADNRYVAFFDTGSRQAGLVFSFGAEKTLTETEVHATAGFRDKGRDALYLCIGNLLRKWDAGTAQTADWTSGVIRTQSEVSMAAARVDAAAYPVTFKLYADGALKHTETVANNRGFRLPSGYRSARYHIQLQTTAKVRSAEFATSMEELTLG